MNNRIKQIIGKILLISSIITSTCFAFSFSSVITVRAEEIMEQDVESSILYEDVVNIVDEKTQYLNEFIDNVYIVMFDRYPDEEGKNYWANQISSEYIGILDFLNQILSQDEFTNLVIEAEDFIVRVYEILFGRYPEDEGLNYWVQRFKEDNSDRTRLSLINEIANSSEFKDKISSLNILFKKKDDSNVIKPEEVKGVDEFINDVYFQLLGRNSDSDGLKYWKDQLTLKLKGALDMINEFLILDEFKNRNLSDEDFLKAVYQILFNREAETDGINYWLPIYKKITTPNRTSRIVFDIADNDEFLKRIKGLDIILKYVDENLFYSEYVTKNNKIRGITSAQLSEIKQGMTFFDIITKLGRTKNVSGNDAVKIAKYTVDGSKEIYFVFNKAIDTYMFNPMDVLKHQN